MEALVGGGPDAPDQCLTEFGYGQEIIVLRVMSTADLSEVVVRYSGCDHNGFDDGEQVRSLTTQALAPLVDGPNLVMSSSGPVEKAQMLHSEGRN